MSFPLTLCLAALYLVLLYCIFVYLLCIVVLHRPILTCLRYYVLAGIKIFITRLLHFIINKSTFVCIILYRAYDSMKMCMEDLLAKCAKDESKVNDLRKVIERYEPYSLPCHDETLRR